MYGLYSRFLVPALRAKHKHRELEKEIHCPLGSALMFAYFLRIAPLVD